MENHAAAVAGHLAPENGHSAEPANGEGLFAASPAASQPPTTGASMLQPAWDEVLRVLQAELSGPTFNNYLRNIKPVGLKENRFTLAVLRNSSKTG
jgi:hypothetical protein